MCYTFFNYILGALKTSNIFPLMQFCELLHSRWINNFMNGHIKNNVILFNK